MRYFLALIIALCCTLPSMAQTELGGTSAPSKAWTMLSIHRVWTPQYNGFPNGGFGVNGFFSLDSDRRAWLGFSILGTGIDKRDALAVTMGMGWWMLGDSKLGAFSFLMSGLGISSANGLTGFGFFSDPTTAYGLATQAGLGGSVEVFTNIKIHLNAFGMWFTTDNGATPLGAQLGLPLGGR